MKIVLSQLVLSFSKSREVIEFKDFSYFHGQMGAGKSSIARLIDFCLGGTLGEKQMTPALQTEFISASLSMTISDTELCFQREANSNQIRASWFDDDTAQEVLLPANKPNGEVIPQTSVEIVSDFIFYISGTIPPKVRRSKVDENSDLIRLSFHELMWYCYLDQDTIDSSFFNLDEDANPYKKYNSRDALRFIIGFHQEKVSELEMKLELVRTERLRCESGVKALQDALSTTDIASEVELSSLRAELEAQLTIAKEGIIDARDKTKELRTHEIDILREKAIKLANTVYEIETAIIDLKKTISDTKQHKNELSSLSTKYRRSLSARDVLKSVSFYSCPNCGRDLPIRGSDNCPVCGQESDNQDRSESFNQPLENDIEARIKELDEFTINQENQVKRHERIIKEVKAERNKVDLDLSRASENYDSIYLSSVLEAEKRYSSISQQLLDLVKIENIVAKIDELDEAAKTMTIREQKIREELKEAREKAEMDTKNLSRLKVIFLDCLLRSKIPGFLEDDIVSISSPSFLPEITSADDGGITVTSFKNLGSGGKKTLYKCCFAIALHRLSIEIGGPLPELLIIDSPMKNISERANREQFEGFYQMIYELSESELKTTQIILIDKEFYSPPDSFKRSFFHRMMKPNDPANPPLISYYRGK